MKIRLSATFEVEDALVDSRSDLDHAVLQYMHNLLCSSENADEAYESLDMHYVILPE